MIEIASEAIQVGRAVLYRFLALAFHEPSEVLMDMFSDSENLAQLAAAAKEVEAITETTGLSTSLLALLEVVPPEGWSLRELRLEYTRLFVGPGETPCPPYESVYDKSRPKEEHGTVQGPTSEALEAALAAEGLVIELGHNELPDHIAIELEYMFFLLRRSLESGRELDDKYLAQANLFLREHLSPWLPEFGERVMESSEHPFYQNLGKLLSAVVRLDAEIFASNSTPKEGPY